MGTHFSDDGEGVGDFDVLVCDSYKRDIGIFNSFGYCN